MICSVNAPFVMAWGWGWVRSLPGFEGVGGLDFTLCAVDAVEIIEVWQYAVGVGWVELFEGLQVCRGAHGTDDAMAGGEGLLPGRGHGRSRC